MEGKGGLSGACALTKGQALAGQRLAILTGTQRGEGQHQHTKNLEVGKAASDPWEPDMEKREYAQQT